MQKPIVLIFAVRLEIAELRERLFTIRACEGPERLVYGKVSLEITGLRKGLLTHSTHKGLLVFVRRYYVILEIRLLNITFGTVTTSVLFLVQVQQVVGIQGACERGDMS